MSAARPLRQGASQPAQALEARNVLAIRPGAIEAGRLDDAGEPPQPWVGQQGAKAIRADPALPNILMPVDA